MDHLRYCFCFMFWFSGLEACGTLAAQPGIEPTPPALGGKVFTTGLPWWQTICLQCRRYRRRGFDPWVGKIPWRRKWLPTAVFLPGEFHGQRSLEGYHPWGCKRVGHKWSTNTFTTGPPGKSPKQMFLKQLSFFNVSILSWTCCNRSIAHVIKINDDLYMAQFNCQLASSY